MPATYDRSHVYERVADGEVVERVAPLDGDYEDTRLGLLALDGEDGWRLAGDDARSNETGASVGALPAKSASKADWVEAAVATAVAAGEDPEKAQAAAEALTKEQLIKLLTPKEK